ncbi:hypothetical protein ACP70R_023018 [Stipagrostis hirtigluma subsp. patula]
MMEMMDEVDLPAKDHELVDRYLRAKIAGELRTGRFIIDADVCSAPPYVLAERHAPAPAPAPGTGAGDSRVWYFFSPVRYVGASKTMRWRTVDGTGGKERWHAEGKDKPVKGSAGGYLTKLSYRVKTAPGVIEKPGWLMVEYGIYGSDDTVLCKVYKSPRGPGRSCASSGSSSESSSGRKRKATNADEHLQVAPPSARARLQTHDDDAMLFAGSLDQDSLSDNLAAAPEFGETQPELQVAPAGVDGSSEYPPELEEMKNFLMADDEDDAMAVQVPYGEDPRSFYARLLAGDDQQLAAMLLACPEPEQQLAVPSGVYGEREEVLLDELKTLLMTDDDDEVPDGVDPMAFFKGLLDLSPEEDATVETAHGQLTDYDVLDGPSTTSAECTGGLPIPAMDPAYIELALSAPDPDDIEELLMASPAPYDSS